MGVFHTIAMFCTTGALSLNNSSQNCRHHLQTLHSSCWQTFFFHLPISLRNPTTVLSGFSAETHDTRFSTTPKRTRTALGSSIGLLFNPRATRGFQPFQKIHPPLSSRDPSLDLDRRSTDAPTNLSTPTSPLPTYTSSTNISANPSPFPTQAQLSDSNHPLRIFHRLVNFRNERQQSTTQAVSLFEYGFITRPSQTSQPGTQLLVLLPPTWPGIPQC